MTKWNASIVLRRFENVFTERTSRNSEALSWKNIRKKSRPFLEGFCHFLSFPIKARILTVPIRFINGSYYLLALIKLLFSCELSNAIWKNNIRSIPNSNVFQLYYYVFICEKYNGDLLQRTSYKKLKLFQFFYEGHIKTMELSTTALFIYVHSKVKP